MSKSKTGQLSTTAATKWERFSPSASVFPSSIAFSVLADRACYERKVEEGDERSGRGRTRWENRNCRRSEVTALKKGSENCRSRRDEAWRCEEETGTCSRERAIWKKWVSSSRGDNRRRGDGEGEGESTRQVQIRSAQKRMIRIVEKSETYLELLTNDEVMTRSNPH